MKKGENFNHPPKGSHITVEPIRSLRDVKKIKAMLADKPRDLALFVAGINTNLRASDLLRLKASDFLYSVPGDDLVLIEQKTHKKRRITINRAVWEAVTNWLNSAPAGLFENEGSPLFPGRGGRPLSVPSVNGLVKGWCRAAGLRGNFGSHTLRKTFGHIQGVHFRTPLPLLMRAFNHSNEQMTMSYLAIQPDDLKEVYLKEI